MTQTTGYKRNLFITNIQSHYFEITLTKCIVVHEIVIQKGGTVNSSSTMGRSFSTLKLNVRFSRGFTLIELMFVMAILGTLAAIAIPSYFSSREKAKFTSIIMDFKSIEMSVFSFSVDNGRFPDTLLEAGLGSPVDPWGRPYVYYPMGNIPKGVKIRKDRSLHPLNTDFDLYSLGADGLSRAPLTAKDSHDDIIRANNGGYYGYAKDY